MAAEDQETLGRTLLRGMMWGAGFTIVAVPLGMLIKSALRPSNDDNDDGLLRELDEED